MKTNKLPFISSMLLLLVLSFGCANEEDFQPKSKTPDNSARMRMSAETTSIKIKRGSYIIISSTNALPSDLEQQVQSVKGNVTNRIDKIGIATAISTDPEFAAKAAKITGIRSVIPDFTVQWYDPAKEKHVAITEVTGNPPFSGEDDRLFDLQWGHDAINAPEAWNAGFRGQGAKVAILDTGFDLQHPDLKPNIIQSISFVPGEPAQYSLPDPFSHGTHVAGTVAAADNGIGTIGVAPEAKLMLVKVLADSGSGNFSWIINGIAYAAEMGANVINMSLGVSIPRNGKFLDDNGTPDDPTDDFIVSDTKAVQELIVAINKATSYAYQKGVTIITSAGNDAIDGDSDQSLVHMPSDAAHVISISATAPRGWALNPLTAFLDYPASYTNFGTSVIDLAAPGGDFSYPGNEIAVIAGVRQYVYVFDFVFSTGSQGVYYWSVGTSMASPHAAGVAALIVGKHNGSIKPTQVETILKASADDLGKPGKDAYYGYGRVNAYRAVANPL